MLLALIGYCSVQLLAQVGHEVAGGASLAAALSPDDGTADVSCDVDSDEGDHGSPGQPLITPDPGDSQVSVSTLDFPLSVDLPPRL